MLMADTMAIVFAILGLMLSFPALWLLCRGLWPDRVAMAAQACSKGLSKPLFLGLPALITVLLIAAVLGKALGSPGKIAGALLISFFIVHASIGIAGLATHIGSQFSSSEASESWRATLRGGVVLELSYLLPILGWFIILPLSIVVGSGASLLAMFRGRERRVVESELSKNSRPLENFQ